MVRAQARGLATIAGQSGIQFGAAVGPWLWNERDFREAVLSDCALIIPEFEWKWDRLSHHGGDCDLSPIKRYLAFADKHGLAIRGHTLVWHRSMPSGFPASADRETAIKLMTGHIRALVGCGAGRIPYWDVVNEAIEPEDGERGGLRRTPLFRQIGPDYIEIAYRTAAQADPAARLVYNDYGLGKTWGAARREAVLRMLDKMLSRGVPIHAVGLQSHLKVGDGTFDPEMLTWFGKRVEEMGLDILVTELDVAAADGGSSDAEVAGVYGEYLSAIVQLPNLKSISTWGLSDRYSWLANEPGGHGARPLLYDARMQRKPAWDAVAGALAERIPL